MTQPLRASRGFTVIELLVAIVLVVIVGTLITLAATNVQAKDRDAARQASINTLQGRLEALFAQNGRYPTLANLNDPTWRLQALPTLKDSDLQDPRWDASVLDCTVAGKSTLAAKPAVDCYSYMVTAANGMTCDNSTTMCMHYTLTATLEGSGRYIKSSLN